MNAPDAEDSPSRQIDAIIAKEDSWKGPVAVRLRALILEADPAAVEEVKWKKPSKPEGVAVWSHDGILCMAEFLKNAVRLTLPHGAALPDPAKLFNARLEGNSVRAIDFLEGDAIHETAITSLIRAAATFNAAHQK